MKRIWILICLAVMLLALVGCEKATMTPIDVRYTPGETVVVYDYSFNILGGKLKGRPEFKEIPQNMKLCMSSAGRMEPGASRTFIERLPRKNMIARATFLEGQNGKT